MFIALEGLDGSGKSTITRFLSQNYGFQQLSKRTSFFKEQIHSTRYNSRSPHNLHIAFLMAFGETSNRIQLMLDQPYPLIVSRWLASELHSYQLHIQQLKQQCIDIDYKNLPVIYPDLVFYIKPSYDVRISRLNDSRAHEGMDYYDALTLQPDAEKTFYNIMNKIYSNFYIIDGDNSVHDCCQEISSIVSMHK
ncbi:hypothetical protein [Dyadobacter frigoris]|uniref:Thymidylate kinase-like domain-containing protein n=1 Tax=Dyadobacter frigoris TaxID=2576211 RepID=A0A4U6D966_9BACT|nr:hypothetical protein [Dyadobacter frigoris]TKT93316.1 hypothetical protein FDK13_05545 [Dyadobacter frigoris]